MSDERAGQEGPTPDFIPGWFASRPGNPDPAVREAVRIPDPGDYFPITFLRSTETVRNPRRPQLGFTIGRLSEPGHELFDLAVPPGYWIVRDSDGALHNWRDEDFKAKWHRSDEPWTPPVDREGAERETVEATIVASPDPAEVGRTGEVPLEALGSPHDQPGANAWKGTPPAKGTRRWVIAEAIRKHYDRTGEYADTDRPELARMVADAVEEALLKIDIGADPTGEVSPASTAMDVLDHMRIPRTREGAILDIGQRVTALADELVEYRRETITAGNVLDEISIPRSRGEAGEEGSRALTLAERVNSCVQRVLTEEESKRLLASTVAAQAELRGEGKVPSGTRELHVVLADNTADSPQMLFVELENERGASVGSFEQRREGEYTRIVIPYGRDDAWVSEVAYQVAGAATRPLLEDHGGYVFPAERVSDAVAELLSDFGIPRACRDCAEEQIGHGAKEVDGRRDDAIKGLSLRCDSLLAQRESARAGEDHWKAQRDAAFRLLQWVLPDLMGHPSDTLGADLADDAPAEDREDAPATPDNFGLSEQARAALAARIEEGRIDPDDLIEIARLG